MFLKFRFCLVTFVIMIVLVASNVKAKWLFNVESGIAYNGYNDIRIPGDTGSKFSLTDDLKSDGTGFIRLRLDREWGGRHRLSFLAAPLRIEASGTINRDIDYNGVRFNAGEFLESRYRFDSYRVTYSYAFIKSDQIRIDLGLTAKVRDASITIQGEDSQSEKSNVGFVPLVNFAIDWSLSSKSGLIFEGDALAAPQGRAEDVLLAIYTYPLDRLQLRLGYRVLEGGADNDEVYSFALVHYLTAGLTFAL